MTSKENDLFFEECAARVLKCFQKASDTVKKNNHTNDTVTSKQIRLHFS